MQAANFMCGGGFLYVILCAFVCEWNDNLLSLYTSSAPRDHAAVNKKLYNDARGLWQSRYISMHVLEQDLQFIQLHWKM